MRISTPAIVCALRSHGEHGAIVRLMTPRDGLQAAYVRGAHANGMMTTAKHFPGHGDTATDSHLSVAQVTGDRARLNSVELAPFRKAIEAGVDSVMVAHVTVPALEPDAMSPREALEALYSLKKIQAREQR